MAISDILNYFHDISASIGISPLALLCTIVLFLLIYIFGLIILLKVRGIRKDLMTANRSLDTITQRIEQGIESLKAKNVNRFKDDEKIKFEPPKQVVRNSDEKGSDNRFRFTKIIEHEKIRQANNSPDFSETELVDNWKSSSDIKNKILYLLKRTSKPISYHEIAEQLSKDSPDHDFDSILKELDQLEKKGYIIGQVAAGKLYFQIKH